jgi:hypothetical protein
MVFVNNFLFSGNGRSGPNEGSLNSNAQRTKVAVVDDAGVQGDELQLDRIKSEGVHVPCDRLLVTGCWS